MGKLSNILENNIINLDGVIEPYAGMQTGFARQRELSSKINQRTIIAGEGIKITQSPQGLIIEACDIKKTITYAGASKLADAVVGTIEEVLPDGGYKITLQNGEGVSTTDFVYEINNLIEMVDTYNEGDKILCFPVLMPEVAVGEI